MREESVEPPRRGGTCGAVPSPRDATVHASRLPFTLVRKAEIEIRVDKSTRSSRYLLHDTRRSSVPNQRHP